MKSMVLNRGKLGWAIEWENGFLSAMPDEATARECAAASDLLEASEEVVQHYRGMSRNPEYPVPDKFWIRGALLARAAIAKAKGGA